ncbi:hypothetical protein BJX66DRAFT_77968 [Aspergillus keveii]|jgi:hypothetical protein|uniref:Uncharacterized protein n=1 Tax=Aspergillus keveii TaxID=714993 RepID=A0ABR4GFF1_9EURO
MSRLHSPTLRDDSSHASPCKLRNPHRANVDGSNGQSQVVCGPRIDCTRILQGINSVHWISNVYLSRLALVSFQLTWNLGRVGFCQIRAGSERKSTCFICDLSIHRWPLPCCQASASNLASESWFNSPRLSNVKETRHLRRVGKGWIYRA